MDGWIKIHRKLKDSPLMRKPNYLAVWMCLLLNVNHKSKKFIFNNETIECKKGETITSRNKISLETGVKPSTVEKVLKWLETEQAIEQQKNNKFRLIKVIKWTEYQKNEQVMEQQSNSNVTAKEQQRDTNNKDKNIKKEKNSINAHFEKWYSDYPRKVGRGNAEKAWAKLSAQEQNDAITGLNRLLPDLLTLEKQFIPHPTTWLNGKRWTDIIAEVELDWDKIGDDYAIAKWLQKNPAHMEQAKDKRPHAHHLSQFI